MSAALIPDDPLLRAPDHELELVWRSSRHARRLLTLSLAAVLIALLAGRPEFAGVAAPALLLLAAGRAQRRNLAPARIIVRVRLSAGRAFEGEAGAALIAYLLTTHLAETGASPGVLRPQVRVLHLGAGLLALGAGAGMVAAAGPGIGSALLRLVAAGALITAAVLVLPYIALRETRRPGPAPLARGAQIRSRDRMRETFRTR